MKNGRDAYILLAVILALLVVDTYFVHIDLQRADHRLVFRALDVGQGDALFIQSPSGTQILFDSGPAGKLMGPLRQAMSPLDDTIDAIVITNPDADHIGNFLDVLKNYKVKYVFESGTITDSKTYQAIKNEIKKQNIPDILARRGMQIDLGAGAKIKFIFPDRDVSLWATNDGSVVARAVYGDISIMLTGDANFTTEKIILEENSAQDLRSTILKAGHHGSKTSSSAEFVQAVDPEYVVVSVGKNNKYGHPTAQALKVFAEAGAKILRTDLSGTIVMHSDGKVIYSSYAR